MSHEIETHDTVAVKDRQAWHGLARVFDEDMTPTEAVRRYINWGVGQRALYSITGHDDNNQPILELVPSHQANYRVDTGELMGVVSANYQVVQNEAMAEFCEALADEGQDQITTESIGSIRNGRRVWILMHGEPFDVTGKDDTVYPYLCVSNGHDGGSSFRVTPTTIRVVCSNTLHAVIPLAEGELGNSAISIKHTTNVMSRIAEAKQALEHYQSAIKTFNDGIIQPLAKKEVSEEDLQKFFWGAYQQDFGGVELNPGDKKEQRRKERAQSAFSLFHKRFDDEKEISGTTAWNMLNGYTGLVQHDRKARGKDDEDRVQRRIEHNLFGLNQVRTQRALETALHQIVG